MNLVKKIDDVGRITIPRDLRRSLRWMDGDEIEIIPKDDGTVVLRRYEDDTAKRLREMSTNWKDHPEIVQQFLDLIDSVEKVI